MRRTVFALLALSLPCAMPAHAQDSEIDRLREALRSTTIQARQLEDQRTALQAKVAQLEKDNAGLKEQVAAAKAKVKQVEKDYRDAVKEFNARLEERNQVLEKWKEAYGEAATVARTKDAERAKFEAESNAFKASTKACTDKNQQLVKVGRELLSEYENVTLGDVLLSRDPVTGIKRTQIKTLLEDYDDKIDTQRVPDQGAQH
jgi:chromosome segregation ATPase